jgi:MtrB/PioB family decaheme-associated outer membrane protein
MRPIISILAAASILPVAAFAQPPAAPSPASDVTVSGSLTPGAQQVGASNSSSKLTEYRDLQDNFYLAALRLATGHRAGWHFSLDGVNVTRNDQTLLVDLGRHSTWQARADWIETPHNLSNKAVTPYIRKGAGLFEVPAAVPMTFKKLATAAADTPSVVASDALVAAYQARFLAPTALAVQTNQGRLWLSWTGAEAVNLGMVVDRRTKYGLKPTFGPIGDRPPRTLNIQLTEPVDYRTLDLTLAAEHQGSGYQVRGEYQVSDFANGVDTLVWQNVFATGVPGATYDVWDRSVSAYGRRPLAPDNRYHTVSAAIGGDLPRDSRVTAAVSYGRLEQNAALLPYSFNEDQLTTRTLPRSTADARIGTTSLTADYVVTPVGRLTLRGFFRQTDMTNDTPSSRWQYVTSDTSNLNGTVAYVNKRVSLPYAIDRQNAGVEGTLRLPRRHSLLVGYEREALTRDYREADTTEQILRATWRARANRRLSFDARYLLGARDGTGYHNQVTQDGYWYVQSEATDSNNPALTFDNHPDMRRYDVSDRRRRQGDARVRFTPGERVALSGYLRYRSDDFDADVRPSQPLLGTGLADQAAASPGDQLGRLEDRRWRYGADVFVQPNDRASFSLFVGLDRGTSLERSLEFNENNKANPSAIATAELGPWTRKGNQWTADVTDSGWHGGATATFTTAPDRLTLSADYTFSLVDIDIGYAGFGVTNFDGTPFPPDHQFAFSTPSPVREDLHVVNLRLEIPVGSVRFILGYTFEDYTLDDWQQNARGPWVEAVGAPTLLRDTSRSFQWGNRLFNLGTDLAPGYRAQFGFAGFQYRF